VGTLDPITEGIRRHPRYEGAAAWRRVQRGLQLPVPTLPGSLKSDPAYYFSSSLLLCVDTKSLSDRFWRNLSLRLLS